MAEFSSCPNKDYNKQSTVDINVLVRSKSMWKSSSETLESPTNSNDMLSFSADDVTSESEFDEHPYSISKRLKVSNQKHCKKFGFQPKFSINKASNIMSEDNEDSSTCWPSSNVNNQINKCLSKTRRKGSKCESKNAVMARLNRLKKKKYVADLEDRNAKLEAENKILKKKLAKKLKEVSSLKRETVNLHSVIRNSTEIGSLLQCVQKNTNLHVTSSILRNGSIPEHHQHQHSTKSISDSASQTAIDKFRPTNYDEALVVAALWGMALHLICQPYKQKSSKDNVSINSNKSEKTTQADVE